MTESNLRPQFQFLKGGGETGALLRAFNWASSPLGDPSIWPECFCTAVSICLNSRFPIGIYWGPDYHLIYNDAYIAIAGDKHPSILGKSRAEVWPEVWEESKIQFDAVMRQGETISFQDRAFMINRSGVMEECYFDYTLSPIVDIKGNVFGIFNAVIESTYKVVNERRNYLLQQLGLQLNSFKTQEEGYMAAIAVMEQLNHDIPFAVLFKYDSAMDDYVLTQTSGISEESALSMMWPLKETMLSEFPVMVKHPQHQIMILPLRQRDGNITGLLVAGLNPAIKLDQSYHQFLASVAFQIGAAINNGANLDKEKQISDRIKLSEDQLEFAIDAAGLATWDLNPGTNIFSGNDRIREWFGLPHDAELALSSAIDVIAAYDQGRVVADIQEAMTYRSGGKYEIDYTIINPKDKAPRIVKAKGKALFNAAHEIIRFSGTLQDITEERKTTAALERAYEQARLSKQAAELGTFDMDLVNGTLEWDERCRLLFGISHHNKVTYDDDFLPGLHEDDRERIIQVIHRAFIKSESDGDYDVEYRTVGVEDGEVRWIRAKGKVFFNEHDEPVRFIGSVFEITDQKQNEIRKNDFIGMVSHELKTPLTSLKAYVQVLHSRAKKEDDNFAASALGKVELQVNKMSGLINGFLNVSRLEAGKIQLNMMGFNLDELVAEIIDETSLMLATHHIELLPGASIPVLADRDKIGQVITNLISNAVKYSPRGKIVEITCEIIGDKAQLSMRDEGMGISIPDKARLFERFYRVESTHTQHISGFGIGLYLSSEIIKRHGGEIWVQSEKGVGSTFFFTLPI